MFQIIRRVSGSLYSRPDRPWREDATSHAPTIGRKRRRSTTEHETGRSASYTPKRTKKDEPVKPESECDSAPEGENSKGNVIPPSNVLDVKEVAKEGELEDEDKLEDVASIPPEDVPLPDSPSRSPDPESEPPVSEPAKSDAVSSTEDQERVEDGDSVVSSPPQDDTEEGSEMEPVTKNADVSADVIAPVVAAIESGPHPAPDTLEVKA